MSTQTTPDDAMAAAVPVVSPGAVIKAMEDPSVFPETARGDLYVLMGHMRQLVTHPNFPTAARLDYAKFLAKLGKVDQPDAVSAHPGAGLPSIQIIFPNSGKTTTINAPARVIDVEPGE